MRRPVRTLAVCVAAAACGSAAACKHDPNDHDPADRTPTVRDRMQVSETQRMSDNPACAGEAPLAIELRTDGVWIGTRAGPHRFVARCGADVDTDGLADALRALGRHCTDPASLAAGPGTRYLDIAAAMDAAREVGLADATLAHADADAGFPAAPAAADRAPARCTPPPPPAPPAAPGTPQPVETTAVMWPRHHAIRDSEVVTYAVTIAASPEGSQLWLNGKLLVPARELAGGDGSIAPLARAIATTGTAQVVLQAERDTPAALVMRVVDTLRAAGKGDIGFALARAD